MSITPPESELITELSNIARGRLPLEEADVVVPLLAALYAGAPPSALASEAPEHLYAAAVNLSRFIRQRTDGPQLRIFNPTLDEHGYTTPHTIIELWQADMPFLVDSVSSELARLGTEIQLVLHPIVRVTRTPDGTLRTLEAARSLTENANDDQQHRLESIIHVRVLALSAQSFDQLEQNLRAVLSDVRVVVSDFSAMRDKCWALTNELSTHDDNEDTKEAAEFLRWMANGDFVFIGYRQLRYLATEYPKPTSEQGLGILRDQKRDVFDWRGSLSTNRPLQALKANARSTVHRPVHLDVVVVRCSPETVDPQEETLFDIFVGLYSLSAYSHTPESIPLLRQKLSRVASRAGYLPNSYDAKALKYILDTYPRDELFQIDEETLLEIARGILYLQHRQRVALFARKDPLGRFVSCLVYIPRDRMDTSLRLRVQQVLSSAYRGTVSSYTTHLTHDPFARLHLIIKTSPQDEGELAHDEIERRLESITQSWEDRLQNALIHDLGEQRGAERSREFRHAFPVGYREAYDVLTAVADVKFTGRALAIGEPTMKLYRPVEFPPNQLRLKVFIPSGVAALSDIVPMLENMGLRVVSEVPHELRPASASSAVRLQDFTLSTEGGVAVDLSAVGQSFIDVFSAVWRGTMGDDGFNKLVLHAGLRSREVKLFRAYARYLRQINVPFSLNYMEATLRRHPQFSRLMVELFTVMFDPSWEAPETLTESSAPAVPPLPGQSKPKDPLAHRRAVADELVEQARALLEGVENLDEDRILHAFLSTFTATTRTNFYQLNEAGEYKDYLVLKFDSARIDCMPKPKPFREIFVFSPRLEGVHLRFGHVARGGLRWSDRIEDLRTEVLGLVKAQQVKNAVIVPVGSKGGFVAQKPPPPEAGRDAYLEEGVRCYETFISGLLDVTDDRRGHDEPPAIASKERRVFRPGEPHLTDARRVRRALPGCSMGARTPHASRAPRAAVSDRSA